MVLSIAFKISKLYKGRQKPLKLTLTLLSVCCLKITSSSISLSRTIKMRFILASTLTLAATAAAMPAENSSQKKPDLERLQQQCGDLTISCCSQVVVQGNGSPNGLGLSGILGTVTGTLTGSVSNTNSVCGQPGLTITSMVGNLIGASRMLSSSFLAYFGLGINIRANLRYIANEEFCNLPDVSYACCNNAKEVTISLSFNIVYMLIFPPLVPRNRPVLNVVYGFGLC
jgi:hypothetical protein